MANSASTEKARIIALIGPTASGKSALSLKIAKRWPCEIISMDSALIYRGMDIGTAKPTQQELTLVPHHLIDILEPNQSYSAAQFVSDARHLIEEIHLRGRIALIVGGTMLYLKALAEGLDPMPSATPELRAEIEAQARIRGWPEMHAELATYDPVTAARLSKNDSQRIQRAIEVYRSSGIPLSAYQKKLNASSDTAIQNATQGAMSMPIISLEPVSRSWLHERIAERFDAMLSHGLVEEVMRLRGRGDLGLQLPSMRCVGYRQVWEMLDGVFPIQELRDRGIAATRQLAKRQITWQRGMNAPTFDKHVVAPDAVDAEAKAMQLIAQRLRSV